jgi:hypothetical protein
MEFLNPISSKIQNMNPNPIPKTNIMISSYRMSQEIRTSFNTLYEIFTSICIIASSEVF